MNITRNFQRLDIYKAVTLVVLFGALVALILFTGGGTDTQAESQELEGTAASEQIAQNQTATTGAGEPAVTPPRPGEESGGLPDIPQSSVVLNYIKDDGNLVTPEGDVVYILSADQAAWVPVVPDDLAAQLGDPAPEINTDGSWLIYDSAHDEQYRWDVMELKWVAITTSPPPMVTDVSGEETEQTTEDVAGAVTETTQPETAPTPTSSTVSSPESPPDVNAATPNLPVPTPTPGAPGTVALHSGEFVYCLARRYNVNPYQLAAYNGLSDPSFLYGGTRLQIPPKADPFPGKRALQAHPTWYQVQDGDTIYSIACLYGDVFPYAIAYANGLQEPYVLQVGQELYIP